MRRDFLHLIGTAASEQAVVNLAVRYLAAWRPEDLAAIPPECLPEVPTDGEALADAAFALTQARFRNPPNELLDEMEAFFAHACARISNLEAAPLRIPGKSYLTR